MPDGHRPPRKIYDLATAAHDYADWSGPPRRTILICSRARSGSTLLGEALYFAGGLGCPLEYFHSGFRTGFETMWGVGGMPDLAAALWRHRTDPSGVLSVKLFWRDVVDIAEALDPDRFGAFLRLSPDDVPPALYRDLGRLLDTILPAPTFVHLYRRDRVRQAVSAVAATQTGRWRSIPGIQDAPPGERTFDYDLIDQSVAYDAWSHGHWRNFFAAIEATPFNVTYEELTADYAAVIGRLLVDLNGGAPAARTIAAVRMERQADGISEAWVLRYLRENARRRAVAG